MYLVDRLDELRAADALRIVHVERQEMLPQKLAPVGPGEAAAERFHGASQLLIRVTMVIKFLLAEGESRFGSGESEWDPNICSLKLLL